MPGQRKHFYEFGAFRVDAIEHLLLRDGERVPLAPMVFNLLLVLIKHPGQALERAWLKEQVWGDAKIGDPADHVLANLNVYIATLRKALGDDPHQPQYIETIPRNGYRFIADVREWEEENKEANKEITESQTQDQTDGEPRRRFLRRAAAIWMILIGAGAAGYYFKYYYPPPPEHPPLTSIAVLPFKLLNDNERDRPLEKGMVATLIPKLGNIDEIKVLHPDKVSGYLDRDQDPTTIGRGLQAHLVLTGNIQSVNDSIRVVMQLIRVKDERQIWSGTFDEKFTDVLSVQDSIASQAMAELARQLTTARYVENVKAFDPAIPKSEPR
jgi:DNA-binding winged helix-turn-helix (wHTH) protein/TolB-like protein